VILCHTETLLSKWLLAAMLHKIFRRAVRVIDLHVPDALMLDYGEHLAGFSQDIHVLVSHS